jgi:hypothetical protein
MSSKISRGMITTIDKQVRRVGHRRTWVRHEVCSELWGRVRARYIMALNTRPMPLGISSRLKVIDMGARANDAIQHSPMLVLRILHGKHGFDVIGAVVVAGGVWECEVGRSTADWTGELEAGLLLV